MSGASPQTWQTHCVEGEIGGYRIVEMLGAGGMGEVYLVEHPRLPRRDALKLLDAGVSRSQEFRSRFRREAELQAQLRHPHIITVYDRGEHEGRLWLAMEYVDGEDVAKLLRRQRTLPSRVAMPIIAGAGDALDYAYAEHGITHRDVKPANILVALGPDGQPRSVKLADFGIAKAAGDSTSLTSTGVTIGTMSYIAPEAIEGRELDNRADLYSLACTAFQMLTGSLPYPAGTIPALMMSHLSEPIPSITARNPQLPAHFDAVFAKALAKHPDERFSTSQEFVEALRVTPTCTWPNTVDTLPAAYAAAESAASAETMLAPPPPPAVMYPDTAPTLDASKQAPRGWRTRRSLVVAAIAVAAVVAVGIATYFLRNPLSSNSAVHTAAPGAAGAPSAAAADPRDGYGHQIELPFTGLVEPNDVAVDIAGNIYVANTFGDAVVKLAAGTDTPITLPFDGLNNPEGLAVDGAGDVYVADTLNKRVMKLEPGAAHAVALPFAGLGWVHGVAVDVSARSVYAAAHEPSRVLRLPADANSADALPFSGLQEPAKVAVDASDDVYVSDKLNNKILKLRGDGTQIELPFADLQWPEGIAADDEGNVYVADTLHNRVLKLAQGADTPVTLPFTGLKSPMGLTVDGAGNVYVTDTPGVGQGRVFKLPARRGN